MSIKLKYLIAFVLFAGLRSFAQQEGQLSLYAFNPIAVNPAYSGSKKVLGTIVSARTQWTSFEGSPKNINLSVHSPLKKEQHNIGLRISSEKNFFNQKNEAAACYAYRFKFTNGAIALGLAAGITNVNFNWSLIQFKDQTDIYANGNSSKVNSYSPRLDGGIYFNNETSFLGISGTHLIPSDSKNTNPQNYNGNLTTHLYFVSSKAFVINDKYTINPTLNCKWVKGTKPLFDLSVFNQFYNCFWIGAGYRSNNSILFMTQAIVNKQFKLGYSFDYFAYKKLLSGFPTHEIMLSYDLKTKNVSTASFRYF